MRARLREHRHRLGVEAASRYPDLPRLAGTPLLTRPEWTPTRPVPLDELRLTLGDSPPLPQLPGAGYSGLMAELDAPTVFENRPTYRLLNATLTGEPRLDFGPGTYFDHIETGEAAAHEYAAGGPTPLRDAIGDPCDLSRRPANLGVSVLTVRSGPDPTFFLHWRDPARVGHAGGLYQVVPVGVFQATAPGRDHLDFSLWHGILREYAEELLGEPERSDVDYGAWPFAAAMTAAWRAGRLRAHCLGLGVDPLTFATDLLVSVVFDGDVFDELLGDWVGHNEEGSVTERPFTAASVAGLPMQAAGAAVVRLGLDADLR
ncbi:hypothetical protein BU204_14985 [Actinophytocola xanthii]|uniref:Uncharacterized protein n=2 Tax=Actinophytocola xanthii TaxID=1912961 RepID=A0A1Q8CR39_9PSEU|nr:hypothetical protein BU204_14985 [Actinophytocola xanthii]